MVTKLRLTPMGVLEVLMWSGGAATMVVFWLLWPAITEKPILRRLVTERGMTAAVLFSAPANTEPENRALQEWRERFRKATAPVEVFPKHENDWPAVTGSSSLAISVAQTAVPSATDTRIAQLDDTNMAVTVPKGSVALIATADFAEAPRGKGDADIFPEVAPERGLAPSHGARPELPGPLGNGADHLAVEPAVSERAEMVPPPDLEPSLNILGLPETDIAAVTPELLKVIFADDAGSVDVPHKAAGTAVSEPHDTVPEVEMALVDALQAYIPQQAQNPRSTDLPPRSGSASGHWPISRDVLVLKGEEMLERGDVSGARLLFQRAANSGNPRAAIGLARTFDPKVLRMLRVYGVRPDPDQAAHWYARSKALETVASTH